MIFQELLNQVEENDVNKKVADRSKEFVAEAKTNTATENEHDLMNDKVFPGHILGACDKVFPSNILGACDKEKKKKNHKRDSSSSNNGSRKSRFNHLLSITHDGMGASNGILIGNGSSQSASSFSGGAGSTNAAATATATAIASTGNSGAAKHFHVGSRRLPRAQQTLSTRMANSKATSAFLTSSSNIDVPTVTTYNKQPIMTPALVPSAQQPSVSPQFWAQDVAAVRIAVDPDCSWSAAVKDGREIEMKVLRRNTSDDGSADADADADANANENDDDDDDDNDNDDDGNKNNDADDDDDGDGDGGGDGDGDGDGDDDDDDGAVYNYTTHASLEIANVAPAKDSDARHSSILFPSQVGSPEFTSPSSRCLPKAVFCGCAILGMCRKLRNRAHYRTFQDTHLYNLRSPHSKISDGLDSVGPTRREVSNIFSLSNNNASVFVVRRAIVQTYNGYPSLELKFSYRPSKINKCQK